MVAPAFIKLPPALRGQIMRRAHGERGLGMMAKRPMFAPVARAPAPAPTFDDGDDAAAGATGPAGRGAQLVIYRDGPGQYRGLAIIPWFYRDASGVRRPCRFAVELKVTREDDDGEPGAVAGAEATASLTQSILHPLLDRVAAVVSHPLAALAASASVLIPGVGPAYLVGYAVAQSLVDYAERNTR